MLGFGRMRMGAGNEYDPYWVYVTLLLQPTADDATAGSYVADATGKAITYAGNAALSATAAFTGGASIVFDGAGDYLSLAHDNALNLNSSEPFVVETVSRHNGAAEQAIVEKFTGADGWTLYRRASPYLSPAFYSNGGSIFLEAADALVDSTWTHTALSFDGSTYRLYVGGILSASDAIGTMNNTTGPLYIGSRAGSGNWLDGAVASVRITKGSHRGYTGSTIAVPTGLWPTS